MKSYLVSYIVDDNAFYHITYVTDAKGDELIAEIEDMIVRQQVEQEAVDFAIINIIDLTNF